MIELKLELVEVNGVLNALGQMPYVQVSALIAKIQQQAEPQALAQQQVPTQSEVSSDVPK